MGLKLINLRSVSRKVAYILISLVAVIAQFSWLGNGVAGATGSSLTYVDGTGAPQSLTGYPSNFSSVSVQKGTLAVVGTDGKVYTANGAIPNLTNVVKAYVVDSSLSTLSRDIGFAIKTDGSLWSWGNALQLGRVHQEVTDEGLVQTDDPNPGQITGLPAIADIEIGARHILALDVNGNVWAWGLNEEYQLGTNSACTPSQQPVDNDVCSTATKYVPEQIQGLSNIKSISAGWTSSVAVTQSGSMKFWGTVCNVETNYTYYPAPSAYPGVGDDVKQALTDGCSVSYLTNSGSVYTWGYAGANPTEPKLVSALQNIESIATDGYSNYFASNRIARAANGIAYRYNASVILPRYSTPVSTIGNIGSSSEYYSYLIDYNNNVKSGALVVDYVAPYVDETIYFNSWTSSGPVFKSILPDGTHLSSGSARGEVNVSPDGSKMVYIQDCDMFTANLDGTNEVNITNYSGASCAQYPSWSPNGLKIAYTTWPQDGNFGRINVMDTNGSNVSTVLSDEGISGSPVAWSPDGTKLVFDHYPGNDLPQQIGTVKTDGSDIQYYAGNTDSDWGFPIWSPDGSKIAFLSQSRDPNASYSLVTMIVMNIDGSQLVTLGTSANNVFLHSMAWSPNSQNIAFVKEVYNPTSHKSSIYLNSVPASGGAVTLIADVSPNSPDTIQWWHKSASAPTLAAPANLAAVSPTKVPVLSWNAVSGATSYKIYRDGTAVTTTTTPAYTDSAAAEGSHTYYVTASNGTLQSGASNSVSVIVDKTRPTMSFVAPSSFAGPFTTGPTVTVNASDTNGLSVLAIHVYTSANQLLTTCGSANPTQLAAGTMSCSLANLPNGTYYIKAGSFDNADNNKTILSGNFTIQHV